MNEDTNEDRETPIQHANFHMQVSTLVDHSRLPIWLNHPNLHLSIRDWRSITIRYGGFDDFPPMALYSCDTRYTLDTYYDKWLGEHWSSVGTWEWRT